MTRRLSAEQLRRMALAAALRRVNPVWTPELVAQARSLWLDGHSVKQIGDQLGFSKNQTSGMIHRNNFPTRDRPGKPVSTPAGVFASIRAAAIHHGISPDRVAVLVTTPESGWSFSARKQKGCS